MCAEISAYYGSSDHHQRLRPVHGTFHNEGDRGHTIDCAPQYTLQRIHGMNARHSERRQHSQIDDANTTAKISSIHGNRQLEYRGHHYRRCACIPSDA